MPTDFTKKKKRDAQWRLDNKERVREYAKKYRKANADRIRENQARWRKANRAKVRIVERRYYRKNREKVLEWQREWRAANPEKVRASGRKARAKRLGRQPYWDITQDRRSLASRARRVRGYYEIETRDRDGVFTVLVSRKDYPLLRQWTSIRRFNSSKHCPRATQENWVVQLCRFVNGRLESAYLGRLILNVTDRNLCVVRRDASSLNYQRRNLKVMTRKQLAAMRRGFTKKEVA